MGKIARQEKLQGNRESHGESCRLHPICCFSSENISHAHRPAFVALIKPSGWELVLTDGIYIYTLSLAESRAKLDVA